MSAEYTVEITKTSYSNNDEQEVIHVEHHADSYDFDWQYIGNELMEKIKDEEQRRVKFSRKVRE